MRDRIAGVAKPVLLTLPPSTERGWRWLNAIVSFVVGAAFVLALAAGVYAAAAVIFAFAVAYRFWRVRHEPPKRR